MCVCVCVCGLLKIDSRLPGVFRGDCHRLQQVFCNLLNNAAKFTLSGSITFEATLVVVSFFFSFCFSFANRILFWCGKKKDETETEFVIRFAVRDTGVGISEEDQKRLFQPYIQIKSGTSHRHNIMVV